MHILTIETNKMLSVYTGAGYSSLFFDEWYVFLHTRDYTFFEEDPKYKYQTPDDGVLSLYDIPGITWDQYEY